jgi:hypothetical protein
VKKRGLYSRLTEFNVDLRILKERRERNMTHIIGQKPLVFEVESDNHTQGPNALGTPPKVAAGG